MLMQLTSVSDDSVTTLLNSAISLQDRVFVLLGFDSGLRLGEVASLNVGSLVRSQASLDEDEHVYQTGMVYGKCGPRAFFISKPTSKALSEYLEEREGDEEEALFKTANGDRLTTSQLSLRLKKMTKKLGLESILFHCFRQSLALRLADAGMTILDLRDVLGCSHATIATFFDKAS